MAFSGELFENFGPFPPLFYLDPGINKPFDRIAKEFADEAPMFFLRLLGIAPPGSEIHLEPLRPETAPHVVMPDYVASLSIDGQDPFTFHSEFVLHYRNDVPATVARYGGSLAWQYGRPVKSVLFLLKKAGVPADIPAVGEFVIGETRLIHPFQTVRLWDLDPGPVLSSGDLGLLPWALLMNLSFEESERLGARIGGSGNERWIARFLMLGGLRYDRVELEHMLTAEGSGGGPRMGLVEAIVQGSSLFIQEREMAEARGEAKGEARGEAKGEAKGRAKEALRLLRLALGDRFPGLETMPELDRIENLADLESLLVEHTFRSQDRDSVARAILAAAGRRM